MKAPTLEKWRPQYQAKCGDKIAHYSVDHIEVDECPVSYIDPQMEHLMLLVMRASAMHEYSGASLFGSDLSKWPIWAYEALQLIVHEDRLLERSRKRALRIDD